jgi:hypothetical protein
MDGEIITPPPTHTHPTTPWIEDLSSILALFPFSHVLLGKGLNNSELQQLLSNVNLSGSFHLLQNSVFKTEFQFKNPPEQLD